MERSSLKKGDGGVIHPHPLYAAPLCVSDLETFGLEEQEGGDGEQKERVNRDGNIELLCLIKPVAILLYFLPLHNVSRRKAGRISAVQSQP